MYIKPAPKQFTGNIGARGRGEDLKIPENYNGNAFSPFDQDKITEEKEFDGQMKEIKTEEDVRPVGKSVQPEKPRGLLDRFPFSHGIGGEELLLLGIMLIVLRSPELDTTPGGKIKNSDLLLMLGLLLISG